MARVQHCRSSLRGEGRRGEAARRSSCYNTQRKRTNLLRNSEVADGMPPGPRVHVCEMLQNALELRMAATRMIAKLDSEMP